MRKWLISLSVIVLLLSGCTTTTTKTPTPTPGGGGTTPTKQVQGVTDTEIVLGSYMGISGPFAQFGLPWFRVSEAYWKYVNDKGGINGRKVRFIAEDDQYNPQKTIVAVKKLVEQDKVFAMFHGTGTNATLAVKDYLVQSKIPSFIPIALSDKVWAQPAPSGWYTNFPLNSVQFQIITRFGIENLKKKKIAVLYQNDDYGKDALGGVKKSVAKFGAEMVAEVPYNTSDVDFSAHAIKLKSSGAEVVVAASLPTQFENTFKESKKIGFSPIWLTQELRDASAAVLGKDYEGVYGLQANPDFKNNADPEVKEFHDFLTKYVPNPPIDELAWRVWEAGQTVKELLTRAGKDLSLESIDKAAESFKNWGRMGITWTASDHSGVYQMAIARWENGAVKVVSGPVKAE